MTTTAPERERARAKIDVMGIARRVYLVELAGSADSLPSFGFNMDDPPKQVRAVPPFLNIATQKGGSLDTEGQGVSLDVPIPVTGKIVPRKESEDPKT